MGRGRAKAKQTRVARKLKYDSHVIDLDRLRQELNVAEDSEPDDEVPAPGDRQEGR
ncbi:Protein of unknown function [Sinosporangium album]|uniref:DUF3073 domain-containing protein n=1 Tax=Sinosporangium album TaxID=504805 RepID=A0A1G8JJ05_9ACTN|nr:DUF3073 family protein [Sinosporangium album]SDI31081.1 Protein of unknown function [Sinosporangium album]